MIVKQDCYRHFDASERQYNRLTELALVAAAHTLFSDRSLPLSNAVTKNVVVTIIEIFSNHLASRRPKITAFTAAQCRGQLISMWTRDFRLPPNRIEPPYRPTDQVKSVHSELLHEFNLQTYNNGWKIGWATEAPQLCEIYAIFGFAYTLRYL